MEDAMTSPMVMVTTPIVMVVLVLTFGHQVPCIKGSSSSPGGPSSLHHIPFTKILHMGDDVFILTDGDTETCDQFAPNDGKMYLHLDTNPAVIIDSIVLLTTDTKDKPYKMVLQGITCDTPTTELVPNQNYYTMTCTWQGQPPNTVTVEFSDILNVCEITAYKVSDPTAPAVNHGAEVVTTKKMPTPPTPTTRVTPSEWQHSSGAEIRTRMYRRHAHDGVSYSTKPASCLVKCALACMYMELTQPCAAFTWLSGGQECRLYQAVSVPVGHDDGIFQIYP